MICPKCYEPLRIAERQGVEIDYCPDCRGVWLDRVDKGCHKKHKSYKKHILKEIIDIFD